MSPWNGTGIRWCDEVLNAVHGCSKTSEGCRGCYAERISHRFGHTEEPWTVEHAAENVQIKPHKLAELGSLPGPRWVFVNSMSDMFHPLVSPSFVGDTLGAIAACPQSAFLILTKHGPETDRSPIPMPRNVLLGVSVESPRRHYRLDWLRERVARTKFVSFEPLVEPIDDPDLTDIDWAIIGGESGPGDARREMDPGWAVDLVESCREQGVAVFFKQHSGPRPESEVRLDLGDGPKRIEEFPDLPSGVVPAPVEFLDRELGKREVPA